MNNNDKRKMVALMLVSGSAYFCPGLISKLMDECFLPLVFVASVSCAVNVGYDYCCKAFDRFSEEHAPEK